MLLRTARAAPRLLRTAPRHKASSVVATVRQRDDKDRRTASSVAALQPRDDEAQRTIAKVVSRYARTQEQLVPWFLEQMPRSYFALVPESSQLAHLQAAAGLFDSTRGFDVLDEVRAASLDDGTVTYLTSGNAPGTLARQVRTLAGQGELTGLKVFTSRAVYKSTTASGARWRGRPGSVER